MIEVIYLNVSLFSSKTGFQFTQTKPLSLLDRGEIHAWVVLHMFTAPFSEVMVNPTWAGDLAGD
jgi:hypothetical protein